MRNLLLPPFVWLASAILMLFIHLHAPVQRLWPTASHWCGAALLAAGLAVAQVHARLFKQRRTNLHTFREPDLLVTERLFRYSRNPMYLGFVLALAGAAVMLGTASPWLVVLAFAAVVDRWYIPFEEQRLHARFGADYDAYRARVRRWLGRVRA